MRNWKKLNRYERIDAIRDGVSRGLSARLIAEELGCTKGAVIGLSDRAGIQLVGGKVKQPKRPPEKPDWSAMSAEHKATFLRGCYSAGITTPEIVGMLRNATEKAVIRCAERNGISRRVDQSVKAKRSSKPAKPTVKAKAASRIVCDGPVGIMDITSGQCKAPAWSDKPKRPLRSPDDWVFCGKPTQPGSSYCPSCHAKFWIKPDRPQRYDRRSMAVGYLR